MTEDDPKLAGLKLLRDNLEVYSAHCLKVKTKDGRIVPFIWNRAQRFVHAQLEEQRKRLGFVRALILKGRQQGISTLVGARFYHRTTMNLGQQAFIVTHEQKATDNLYQMVRRYHDHNLIPISTGATNAKELIFDLLDGGYKLATAGTKDVGRSNTAQLLHGCLGAGALVMMADGSLRAIETLEPGDVVRTRRGFEAPVKGISWHSGSTRELRIAMNGLRLRATDSHKFWTRRGMVALADLRVGDELGFPVREITEEILTTRFACDPTVRAHGGGRSEAPGPESMPLTFELGRMLGLYLAEGHVDLQTKAPHAPAAVIFACHERELERNTAWVREVGGFSSLSERSNKGSKTRMTNAYGRQFASFVLRMCGRNGGKHLPHEWWRMPREFVRGLLVGYLAGDGHCSPERDRRIQAPSIVPAIAYGMRDVVAALGYGFPSVSFRDARQRGGRNEKAQYTLRITGSAVDAIAPMLGWEMPPRSRAVHDTRIQGGYAWLAIDSIGDPADEMVWDIEVDHPDHDYCLTQCATSNSEFGFWANAQSHLAGIGNTIVDAAPTEIILESTGNGLGNAFHLMWQDAEEGKGLYIPIFVPWFWQEEYRAPVRADLELSDADIAYRDCHGLDMEQMQWRANKITSYGDGFAWLFDQEYPACVVAGTRVGTSAGLIKIEDVASGMAATMGAIEASNKQPPSQIFKLTTSLGYEFRGTWDHPVFTAGGVLLPMMSCKGVDIRLQPPMLAEAQHVERWREFGVDSSIRVEEDFGLLLGLFMGDGSLYDGCVSFCCDARDGDVVAECQRLLQDVLGISSATRQVGSKGGGVEVRAQRKELTAVFDRLGLLRDGAGNSGRKRMVCVPECIWRSPRPVVIQFLRGLFESDGFNGYGHPRVTLFSKHKDFLGGTQLLLLALGITSRLGLETSRKGDKTHVGYSLTMRRNESIKFNEVVGFISKRKSDKAASWRAVGKTGARRLEIEMVDRVASVVEDGFEATYDMTVRGGEAFDANGILTHNTAALAFQTGTMNPLCSPHFVSSAANGDFYDEAGALIIGCDPASDGASTKDRTCIVFRRGRVVFRVEYHDKLSSMQVAGKLANYYAEFDPDAIFVDKGGIGTGIVDRLQELQIPVIGVMFGEAASEPDIYANKKAEMWWRMKDWFEEKPNRIVNNPAFISDICAPQPDVSSNGRKLLESKEKLEKRQIRSPDGGDALALTFAEKVMSKAAMAGSTKTSHETASKAGY